MVHDAIDDDFVASAVAARLSGDGMAEVAADILSRHTLFPRSILIEALRKSDSCGYIMQKLVAASQENAVAEQVEAQHVLHWLRMVRPCSFRAWLERRGRNDWL